jgi:exopolysaccharide biosynthesis operon protein EpsL
MKVRKALAAALLLGIPALAPAFEALDGLYWPSTGRFPAYPIEDEARRLHVYGAAGLMRDDNLFRVPDGAGPQSVSVRRVGLGLRARIPISRQRLLVDAAAYDYDYSRFHGLDHVAYRGAVNWQWLAGDRWRGELGYRKRRYQSGFEELRAPVQDLVTEDHLFAGAAYGLTARLRARGLAEYSEYNHDNVARNALDFRVTSGTLGLDYVTPEGSSAGGQVKLSDGTYPNRQVLAAAAVDNSFRELETSAVVHWIVTGKSNLDARLGYTSRKHDQAPARDFSGLTGRLGWDWFVGAKTLLNFAVWREVRAFEDVSASYVVSRGAGFGPAWAPTSKIVLQARLLREDRDFRGDPGISLSGNPQRKDQFTGLRFAAGYAPTRNVELSAGFDTGKRDSNLTGVDYDYNAVSANVKVGF